MTRVGLGVYAQFYCTLQNGRLFGSYGN